jgi:hypothetical protein
VRPCHVEEGVLKQIRSGRSPGLGCAEFVRSAAILSEEEKPTEALKQEESQ